MTEKRQTSQGYIIRILQHFATKLRNITNFVMLFQAVMKFLSRLVEIKILSITQVVNSTNILVRRNILQTQRVTVKAYSDKCYKLLIVVYLMVYSLSGFHTSKI